MLNSFNDSSQFSADEVHVPAPCCAVRVRAWCSSTRTVIERKFVVLSARCVLLGQEVVALSPDIAG